MSYNEYVAHFSFWCLLAAPLMAGNDLREMDDSIKGILLNKDAIAINQDVAGIQGSKVYDEGDFEIWKKELDNGDIAVIYFNRNQRSFNYPTLWEEIGVTNNMTVYDIWKHENIGEVDQLKDLLLDGHSVKFFRLTNTAE